MITYQLTGASNAADTTIDTECNKEEACPICAGKHKLKDCAASRTEYKCINCERFNPHNKDRKTQVNHSSLDRSCPSLQAMIVTDRTQTIKMALTNHHRNRTPKGHANTKTREPISCMQINLQHSRIAKDNLMKLREQEQSDILFIQEPCLYKHRMSGIPNSHRIYTSLEDNNRASIVITNKKIDAVLITQ
jgi:hypothetical protein